MYEIPLIPVENLIVVYDFIGVDQDKGRLALIVHASGAIAVFIFGIIYLRSRRIDELSEILEAKFNISSNDKDMKTKSNKHKSFQSNGNTLDFSKSKSNADDISNMVVLDMINEENNSSFESDSEIDENEEDHIIWRIYDKIIDAVTSQFIVINLCRLGL